MEITYNIPTSQYKGSQMNAFLINFTKAMIQSSEEVFKSLKMKTYISEEIKNISEDLKTYKIHLVIINWPKNDAEIIPLVKKIKKDNKSNKQYILVIAPKDKSSKIEKLLQSGLDNFLFKPFIKDELYLRLKIASNVIGLYSKVSNSQKKVLTLAKEDPQTGMLNRRSLLDQTLNEMGRSSRKKIYICSLLVSITNFKSIVSKYGDKILNEMLQEFSRRLKKTCRPYDLLGRYSIANFMVFLPDVVLKDAEKVAERLIDTIALIPIKIKNEKISISLSIGISELDPADVAKNNRVDDKLMNDLILDSLIRRTEFAMNSAIENGKNKIHVYSFS